MKLNLKNYSASQTVNHREDSADALDFSPEVEKSSKRG
jgi:hypothetical protein